MLPIARLLLCPLHNSLRIATLLLLGLVLAACGGGGGGGGGGTSAPAGPGTGVFFDAPTQGLRYVATPSGLTGTTSATGTFQYETGDTVAFFLPLGGSNELALGSFTPIGSNAQVNVLALTNGQLVAQILQSLDHSSSADHQDVSGLTLAQADVDNLSAFLASGGTTLPAGKTAKQMLADAQAGASNSPSFVHAGGVSMTRAVTNARTALDARIAAQTPVNARSIMLGRMFFHTGFSNYGPIAQLIGINASGSHFYFASAMKNRLENAELSPSSYSHSGNQISLGESAYFTLLGDSSSGMTSFHFHRYDLPNEVQAGVGSYRALESAALNVDGKLVTVSGMQGCAGSAPITFAFSADGTGWTSYCGMPDASGNGAEVLESGSVTGYDDLPQVGVLGSSCGVQHFVGVLQGGLAVDGQLAVLTPPRNYLAIGRAETPTITAVGTATAAMIKAYTGSCEGVGFGPDITATYSGSTISGTVLADVSDYDNGGSLDLMVGAANSFAPAVYEIPAGETSAPFQFFQVPESGNYQIIAPENCTVTNGTGTLDGTPVDDVTVDCRTFSINADITWTGFESTPSGSMSLSFNLYTDPDQSPENDVRYLTHNDNHIMPISVRNQTAYTVVIQSTSAATCTLLNSLDQPVGNVTGVIDAADVTVKVQCTSPYN